MNKQEYLCPICQRLSNSVLPNATNLTKHIATKPPSRKTFNQWLKDLEHMVNKNVERKKSSKIPDNFEEVDNLMLDYKIDLESLLKANFDETFAAMTTNFAECCVTVSEELIKIC